MNPDRPGGPGLAKVHIKKSGLVIIHESTPGSLKALISVMGFKVSLRHSAKQVISVHMVTLKGSINSLI